MALHWIKSPLNQNISFHSIIAIFWLIYANIHFFSLSLWNNSIDTRDSDFGVAEQWSGGDILGQRATFRADRHPAALILTNVKPKDEALYRCRVDFRLAQTRNAHVNLTVIGNVNIWFSSFIFGRDFCRIGTERRSLGFIWNAIGMLTDGLMTLSHPLEGRERQTRALGP